MTTKEIADRLVELCRKYNFKTVQADLFAEDAVSL
ncbi:MAG TPA: SnoaL-like domain-containing protein [Chitinophagaceae bacterium]